MTTLYALRIYEGKTETNAFEYTIWNGTFIRLHLQKQDNFCRSKLLFIKTIENRKTNVWFENLFFEYNNQIHLLERLTLNATDHNACKFLFKKWKK